MRQIIKDALVDMHKTVGTDRYGQVHKRNFVPSLFGEHQDDVMDYCKENPGILKFSTYGGRFGNYIAFTVEDMEIKKAMREALMANKNYLDNVNSY